MVMLIIEWISQMLFLDAALETVCYLGMLELNHIVVFCTVLFTVIIAGIIREKVEKLVFFLGIYLLLISGTVFLLTNTAEKQTPAILLTVLCLTLLLRFLPDRHYFEQPNVAALIFLAGFYLINYWKNFSYGKSICYWAFFITLLLHVIYHNYKAADRYILDREGSTKMDAVRLKRISHAMTFGYVAIIGVVLFLFSFRASALSSTVLNALKRFLTWFFALIHGEEMEQALPEVTADTEIAEVMLGQDMEFEEPSKIWVILDKLLQISAMILLVVVVIGMIYVIVKSLYENFYKAGRREGDITEFVSPFETKEEKVVHEKKKRFSFFEQDPGKKVRKIYKKQMKGFWGKEKYGPSNLNPTEQIKLKYGLQESDEEVLAEQIIEIYEKARYSEEQVSVQEAEEIKKMFEKTKKSAGEIK